MNSHARAFRFGAKLLFHEAVCAYLKGMKHHHHLTYEDKDLIWLAISGLRRLQAFPYACALIRMAFAEMSAKDLGDHFVDAIGSYQCRFLRIPF